MKNILFLSTITLQYHNIVFRSLISNIYCEELFYHINIDYNNFVSHDQNVVILKELQTTLRQLYIEGKRTIMIYLFFISDKHQGWRFEVLMNIFSRINIQEPKNVIRDKDDEITPFLI